MEDQDKLQVDNKRKVRISRLEKEFYSSGQAAKLLGIPSRTMRRYLTTGKIDGIQNPFTQTWQVSAKSLAKFVAEQGGEISCTIYQLSVFVINCESIVIEMLQRMIESSHIVIRYEEFIDANSALLETGVKKPNMVIIDTSSSYYNGPELCRTLSNNSHLKTTQILAITSSFEDVEKIENLGAAATLVKPFTYHDLIHIVEYMFPQTAKMRS